MNFLFGLIPAIGFILLVILLAYIKILSWKVTRGAIAFILVIAAWISINSYGPRVELAKTYLTYVPESVEVPSGANMIEPKQRLGQFDTRIEQEQ